MYRNTKDNSPKFVKHYENMMSHSLKPLHPAANTNEQKTSFQMELDEWWLSLVSFELFGC